MLAPIASYVTGLAPILGGYSLLAPLVPLPFGTKGTILNYCKLYQIQCLYCYLPVNLVMQFG